ncbi:MAG: aldolase catalytic domain-containing protein [bacterium]
MFRPEIKVFDCTIRDGGLMNNWDFDEKLVKGVFEAMVAAGVDYTELGYRVSKKIFSPKEHGPWRFSDEETLRKVAYECDTKISVMLDMGRVGIEDVIPKSESIIHTMRLATYVKDIDKALEMGKQVKDMGYEVFVNIMAVSHALEPDLDEALQQCANSNIDGVYLVDSFGYLYSEQIQYLCKKYLRNLPGKKIGVHCHNNQQLAFANTIEAIICGVNYLDATIYGIGRAAGNCPLELLMGFLKNPKFKLEPILNLISSDFKPLHQKLEWGYQIPYAITGMLNKHPKIAMALMKSDKKDDFAEFYGSVVDLA